MKVIQYPNVHRNKANTWTATQTFSGADLDMGNNLLKFGAGSLFKRSGTTILVRDAADANPGTLSMGILTATGFLGNGVTVTIDADNTDGRVLAFRARDTGVGLVTTARVVGAADAYFEATLPMVLLPIATASLPATPVEGMITYDATVDKLKFYNGAAWETVTSAVV